MDLHSRRRWIDKSFVDGAEDCPARSEQRLFGSIENGTDARARVYASDRLSRWRTILLRVTADNIDGVEIFARAHYCTDKVASLGVSCQSLLSRFL